MKGIAIFGIKTVLYLCSLLVLVERIDNPLLNENGVYKESSGMISTHHFGSYTESMFILLVVFLLFAINIIVNIRLKAPSWWKMADLLVLSFSLFAFEENMVRAGGCVALFFALKQFLATDGKP